MARVRDRARLGSIVMTMPATSQSASEGGETLWERAERRAREASANRSSAIHPTVARVMAAAAPPTPEEQAAHERAMLAEHREARRADIAFSRAEASRRMLSGAVIFAIGVVVTWVSYAMVPSGGGRYVIAAGAILAGGVRFVRGLVAYVAGWHPDA
jgi:hypothetical protein